MRSKKGSKAQRSERGFVIVLVVTVGVENEEEKNDLQSPKQSRGRTGAFAQGLVPMRKKKGRFETTPKLY